MSKSIRQRLPAYGGAGRFLRVCEISQDPRGGNRSIALDDREERSWRWAGRLTLSRRRRFAMLSKPSSAFGSIGLPAPIEYCCRRLPSLHSIGAATVPSKSGHPRLQSRVDRRHRARNGKRCFRGIRAQEGHPDRGWSNPSPWEKLGRHRRNLHPCPWKPSLDMARPTNLCSLSWWVGLKGLR